MDDKWEEFTKDLKNRPWKPLDDKGTYKAFYHDETSGLRSIKSVNIINRDIKTIYDYLDDISVKGTYDKSLNIAKNIRRFDNNYSFNYLKYNGKWPVKARDFTTIAVKNFVNIFI